MSENIFLTKSKADLLQIVRVSGVMPISKAQKMKKGELAEHLSELMSAPTANSEKTEPIPTEPLNTEVDNRQAKARKPRTRNKSVMLAEEEKPRQAENISEQRVNPPTSSNETNESTSSSSESALSADQNPEITKSKNETRSKNNRQKRSRNQKRNQDSTSSTNKINEIDEKDSAAAEAIEEDEFTARPRPSKRNSGQQDKTKQTEDDRPNTEAEKKSEESVSEEQTSEQPKIHTGVLELMPDGYGFLRSENYIQGPQDVYISAQMIRRFSLRAGDYVKGTARTKRDQDRYQALNYIEEVNGLPPAKMSHRPHFERLTPIYPTERYTLETDRKELATRIIDLFSPIGKGQRGMIVSPPKAGKTILLQKIANSISINNPDAKLIVLLIDERPEEVTDMQRRINGEVVYSTFDKTPENHVKITELVLERAKRLVELGQDVVILLDSMTRMARAYNLTITPTGRTLSGGLDPGALYHPKRFFGAARNIENGGSLTIVATSLIETGSRMDEVIFEEFKGTGNMEVLLDRKLSEKRIFPAIDINKSGTRREELLLTQKQLGAVWGVRKAFGQLDTSNVTELIINLLLKTKDNDHMIDSLNISLKDQAVIDAMRLPQEGQQGNHHNGKLMSYSR